MRIVPIIVGPTAVGKSELAFELAQRLDSEIVSADARQIYKFMDIGTAKPPKEWLQIVPHHMIDIVTPDVDFNAWHYACMARKVIDEIFARNKLPIVVGGSGLYIKALVEGFFELPVQPTPELRNKLRATPTELLYEELKKVDPITANRLAPRDKQRIARALEVYYATGKPISYWQSLPHRRASFTPLYIGLIRERQSLYERINIRVDKMFEQGLVEEVKHLLSLGYSRNLNALQTIGYKEVIDYLEGKINLDEAKRLIKKHTRMLARRQIQWFKKLPNIEWYTLPDTQVVDKLYKKITHHITFTEVVR